MFGVSSAAWFLLFLKSVGLGYLLGAFYGVFILLRRVGLRQFALVVAQDLVFAILAGFFTYLFLYVANSGVPRLFIFAGEGLGFGTFYLYKLQME